ncbi:putative disease resistance protein RGA3 [Rosa sericea]
MTIGSSLLLSAAGGAVGNVASLATDQLSLKIVFCFSKAVDELKRSSTQIGNLIHDAALEPEDGELRAMANWMKSLMTVAYAAEDAVDEVQYEFVRIDQEATILDKDIRRIFVRLQMACKIGNINKSLDDLYKKAAAVGLTRRSNGGAAASRGKQDRETTSLLEKHEFTSRDANIVGRDEVVPDITATLTNPNNQEKMLLVMAVVGLPGVGKTTLARLLTEQLMKEGEMKKPFDITLWVYVSTTFNVNSILRGMLESCEAMTANSGTRQALIQSLRQTLKEKRYFLVLDDVWNEDDKIWEDLKSCLRQLESAKGSTVIVTTRSARVAEIMGTLPNYDLGILHPEECWSIIKDRAFDDPNPSIDSDQERIGREIARKCAGLPLVAKILGSLMHSKNSSDEWRSILQSPTWQLLRNHKDSGIMSVLMLSFDNLKSPLKPCFAYCSMLDRGSLIKRDQLIQLWMAQGFLNPSPHQRKQKREMEDIGNEYFDTLLEKSLFQDATKDEDDVITECKMHDLVHEFAVEVSRCESWTPDYNHEMDDSEIRHDAQIPTPELESMPNFNQEMDDSEIRHVARISTPELESMPETSIARLRSLFLNVQVSNIIFPKLRALRALSFYEAETQELLNSLDNLKHLRYLDLSHAVIRKLPESLGKLYNLQTLRLPWYLDKCPKEIQNLINLRHLYVGDGERTKFEAGILRRLTNLRALRYFNVGKEIGPAIEELGGLNQLRGHLIIDGLENVRDREEAKNACLVKKSHLHGLTFEWTHSGLPNENQTDVLDGLEPHGELQRLNIGYFMGARFPSWIESLLELKEIRLVGCNNCEEVPTLGNLPFLRFLKIDGMHKLKFLGAEFYGTGTTLFPALKKLQIFKCRELIEWMEAPAEGEVVFPCLEELNLGFCPNLGNAPSRFPCLRTLGTYKTGNNMTIENISTRLTTLTSLAINGVKRLTCLPEGMLKKNNSLTYLEIRSCDELTCIAPDVFGCCESLRSLIVLDCKKLSHLPDGLDKLPLLERLRIHGGEYCPSLESIQITRGIASLRELKISSCEGLSSLEVGLHYCTSLQELNISGCPNLMSIPITQCMPSLRILEIISCKRLSSLGLLDYCISLQQLEIGLCDNLTSIPITEGITSLQRLRIYSCQRLLSLPSGLQFCTSLQDLEIAGCSSLVSISVSYHVCDYPDSTSQPEEVFTGLVLYLSIPEASRSLESIPADLRQSFICNCGKLKYEPTGFHSLTRLKKLTIGGFWEELEAFPDFQLDAFPDFQLPWKPSQLENLKLWGWPQLESLPQQVQQFTCLKTLEINYFEGLLALPPWLRYLTSLESLSISDCENLKSLPPQDAMESLTKLKVLSIKKCPPLEERCTKETGPEWPKISHIPEPDCPGIFKNAENSTSFLRHAENSTSFLRHAENSTSFLRHAENSTSSPRNAALGCLPCCIL